MLEAMISVVANPVYTVYYMYDMNNFTQGQ